MPPQFTRIVSVVLGVVVTEMRKMREVWGKSDFCGKKFMYFRQLHAAASGARLGAEVSPSC